MMQIETSTHTPRTLPRTVIALASAALIAVVMVLAIANGDGGSSSPATPAHATQMPAAATTKLPVAQAAIAFANNLLTVGTQIGNSVAEAITSAQGTAPYTDRVSFRFNQLARDPNSALSPGMCCGDTVRVTRQTDREVDVPGCRGNGDCRRVEFCIINSADNWWKAITKHNLDANRYETEIVSTSEHNQMNCGYVTTDEFANHGFVLSKAGGAGVHTNVHLIQGLPDLVVGGSYLFDWQRC